jgi:hypothetical protein
MAGLVPAIHIFLGLSSKTWMPGTRPGMTTKLRLCSQPYSEALALAPPLETATSAGRSTRSPIM